MMDYLISNIGTIVVFLIIAAVVTLIRLKTWEEECNEAQKRQGGR